MAELKKTALYDVHVALGARMAPFAGYAMPTQYDSILAEHQRVRQAAGMFDVSHMGELRIVGPDATAAVNRLVTNDLTRIKPGRAQYTCLCHEDGTIVDDLIVYRLAEDVVFICVNAANRHVDLAHIQARITGDCRLTDESDAWSQIAVQGPGAAAALARVFGGERAGLRPFRIRAADFQGAEVLYATTGYTGEAGAELYVPNGAAVALWEALMTAGQAAGVAIGPAGLGARDTLRLEMGYCLYGNDIDRSTTPLEAGLDWITRLDKNAFVGRSALVAQRDAGLTRALVGFELLDKGIARHGYTVEDAAGEPIGAVTSGTKGPTVRRSIGLAYVATSHRAVGTEIVIDIRGKKRLARVVTPPFHTRGA